ncbi:MAG TPA: VTT domain-containing protein [Chlamydiales bacterium]|nr:VTT domain-containing protein [Chlamydiales bacterium]
MESAKTSSKLYQWAIQKATSSKAPLWMGLLFFLELFLFIPLDPILLFFSLQRRSQIFFYCIIAAIASTFSACIGYLAAHFLWDLLEPLVIPHLISAAHFAKVSSQFEVYEHWALFFGALLPFPLKALSLTAGVFHLGLLPFASLVLLARLIRFFLIGGVIAIWGEKVHAFVERHFQRILLLIGAKIAAAALFLWVLAK